MEVAGELEIERRLSPRKDWSPKRIPLGASKVAMNFVLGQKGVFRAFTYSESAMLRALKEGDCLGGWSSAISHKLGPRMPHVIIPGHDVIIPCMMYILGI